MRKMSRPATVLPNRLHRQAQGTAGRTPAVPHRQIACAICLDQNAIVA